MPTPSKPLALVEGHRTKTEKKLRQEAEAALITGQIMSEWPGTKADKIAHAHFVRISELLAAIDKDDALLEPAINRYCQMLSECEELQSDIKKLKKLSQRNAKEHDLETLFMIDDSIMKKDKLLQTKRRMLLNLEKESGMTLAAQLRSIPKTPAKEDESPMVKFLKQRRENDTG